MEIEQSGSPELNETSTDSSFEQSQSSDETQQSASEQSENNLVYDGEKLSEKLARNPNMNLNAQEIVELEKLQKFRFGGKTITASDLKNMVMMQKNYTQKTQELAKEREAITQNKKYYEALAYDLEKIEQDPRLVSEFKKVYPKEFHQYVKRYEARLNNPQFEQANRSTQVEGVKDETTDQESKILSRVEQLLEQKYGQKLSKLESDYESRSFEAAKLEVDSVFDKMLQKYPLSPAYESWVAQKLLAEREAWREAHPNETPPRPDVKMIEELFKTAHQEYERDFKGFQSKLVGAQKAANEKGRGPGAGGGTPGQAPKVAKSIREATQFALSDPAFQ